MKTVHDTLAEAWQDQKQLGRLWALMKGELAPAGWTWQKFTVLLRMRPDLVVMHRRQFMTSIVFMNTVLMAAKSRLGELVLQGFEEEKPGLLDRARKALKGKKSLD